MKPNINLWVVIPAYKRYTVTDIILGHYKNLQVELIKAGVDLDLVVVADDKNIELAKSYNSFHTVIQNNDFLGRKFNDGIEYACKQKADCVMISGSDDLVHEQYIQKGVDLLRVKKNIIVSSNFHSMVSATGKELGVLNHRFGNYGVGPYIIPRKMLEKCNSRPAMDTKNRSLDSSYMANIFLKNNLTAENIEMVNDFHLQYVALKTEQQIWAYGVHKKHFIKEFKDPLTRLAAHYPESIEDITELYSK